MTPSALTRAEMDAIRERAESATFYTDSFYSKQVMGKDLPVLLTEIERLWADAARRDGAAHALVEAIYFADSSDYKTAMWTALQILDPGLAMQLSDNAGAAYSNSLARTDVARPESQP